MSLQRIIEVARRQGMPVILTDVAGREPMVVLPLEAYEKMLDGEGQDLKGEGQSLEEGQNSKFKVQNDQQEKVQEPKSLASHLRPLTSSSDGLRVRQRDEDRTEALHRSLETVSHEVSSHQGASGGGEEGMVLEERFSFQP